MKLEKLFVVPRLEAWEDGGPCPTSDCPSLYRTEGGDFVVQGLKVCDGIRAEVDAPADEDAVIVPRSFIEEIIKRSKGI